MPLDPGTHIGPYEIAGSLGAGGMGEVFRARDTRLGRDIALKILPEVFAKDESRRARFSQEARAAGALNHPGIVAVYDIGLDGGIFYMAMELVEGVTLRAMLLDGRLPQRKAIDLAVQIAEALAPAHAAGITHRDLKPENIMVTHEGRVKLLDFGLAKQAVHAASADAFTETQAITQEGTVMGTIGYMAPEQVRGKPVDARSDIFSFGAVVYEMLAGRRAYQRETSADTLSAILREDVAEMPENVAPGLTQIVRRCLEKEPAQRFQSAADLAFALRSLSSGATVQTEAKTGSRASPKHAWFPWAIAALALATAAAAWLFRPSAVPMIYRITPATSYSGNESNPSLSPDGKQLAFTWTGEPPGLPGIYVKLLSSGSEPLRVSPADKTSGYPSWSPDGSRIAYSRTEQEETSILVAPAIGGPERKVARYANSEANAMDWSTDGKWIAFTATEDYILVLKAVSPDTGEILKLTSPSKVLDGLGDKNPRFSPDGNYLAFVRSTSLFSSQLYSLRMRRDGHPEGAAQRIGDRNWNTATFAWFPDSKSVVVPAGYDATCEYWKVPIVGRAFRLPLELSRPEEINDTGNISIRGSRMATVTTALQEDIGRLMWSEKSRRWEPAPFYGSSYSDGEPEISTNGQWLVFRSSRNGSWEVWRSRPDGTGAMPITSSEGDRVGDPRWSPDGQRVVYELPRNGFSHLYVVSSEGGEMRRLTDGPSNEARASFSADGKWIYFRSDRGKVRQLWKIPSTGGNPEQVTQLGGHESFESPDGRWLYYIKWEIKNGVFRIPAAGGEEQLVVREPGMAAWAVAGNSVYLGIDAGKDPARIVRFDPMTGKKEEIYRFPPGVSRFDSFAHSLSVSRDEHSIYHSGHVRSGVDILLVDEFR